MLCCLRNEQECIIRFKKLSASLRVFKPDNKPTASFLNGFTIKVSQIDQLILALIFRLGV